MGKLKPRHLEDDERSLVRELYAPLRRFACVTGPPEVDPDDLVQDAFLQALRRGPLADLESPLAYLRQIVLHLASNHRRRLGRRRRAMSRLGDRTQVDPAYPSDLADLMALSVEARAVLYLSEVEGYRFGEIAAILGCSESAARQRASRARNQLREVLAKEGT